MAMATGTILIALALLVLFIAVVVTGICLLVHFLKKSSRRDRDDEMKRMNLHDL